MKNIFADIPKKLPKELFETLIVKENLKIERIISKGHISQTWYDQSHDEWVIILQGEAVLTFEDEKEIKLSTGDYINIPAHTKHKVTWTKPDEETIWLAIHY